MQTGYYISKKDYDTIINYAQAAYDTMKAEIGGMAICYQDKDGDWIVTDPVILKQDVTGSTCDLDKEELANYYCKAAKKHKKKNFRFCWWHSHHTMDVFWSSTDIKGIEEYSDGDMSFALVVNLKRENKFRTSMWKPVVMHEDTTLEILDQKGSSVPKKILKEVDKLCNSTTKKWEYPKYQVRKPGEFGFQSGYQANVFGDDDFGYSYGGYGMWAESRINHGITGKNAPREQMYSYCWNKLIDWMDDLSNGTLSYESYVRQVDDANKELELMKSPCTFVKITMSELTDDIEYSDPSMWIRESNEEKEEKTNGVSLK